MSSIFKRIYHPTDFSQGSQTAFEHALKLTLNAQGVIRIVHVGEEATPPWEDFPGVRFTLEKWGLLESGSAKSEVAKLGIEVQKSFHSSEDRTESLIKDMVRKAADLVVMASHARSGLSRYLHSSVFKSILRESKKPVLMVPHGVAGFISAGDGTNHLRRVLIPVSPEVCPQQAVELGTTFLHTIGASQAEVRLVYVGSESEAPALRYQDSESVHWDYVTRNGEVVEVLSNELAAFAPQLVVMMERGRNSVMDYLIPGKVERLAGESECPLLVKNVSPE